MVLLKGYFTFNKSKRINRMQQKSLKKPVTVLGLTFPNPVGLAAGLDKNGDYIDELFGLGAGFIELGAVTPQPQSGNPKPRLFRLPPFQALINRLGFNNKGVSYLVSNLKNRKIKGIVGVNIGKNATTSIQEAVNDYEQCFRKVYPYVDFVTLNISSPNTIGLRELQKEVYLLGLLARMKKVQQELSLQLGRKVPLLIKISPDMEENELDTLVHILLAREIEGVVAVNTTQDRCAIIEHTYAKEQGGLSGAPLFSKTLKTLEQLTMRLPRGFPIIAVGGVSSGAEAKELLKKGASLVQLYTGLIYQGPGLIKKILQSL